MNARQLLSVLLSLLLIWTTGAAAQTSGQRSDRRQEIAKSILEIPEGSPIEVKLLNKESLRGRLGKASSSAFQMQHVKNEKVVEREFQYDEVKSVRQINKQGGVGHKVGWIVVGALAGVGVLVLALAIAYSRT